MADSSARKRFADPSDNVPVPSEEEKEEEAENKAETKGKGKANRKAKKAKDAEFGATNERRSSKLISDTLASTAHLANLLPTGTVLAFQMLVPLVTNNGNCDYASAVMTKCFLVLCGVWCFFVSFTDSFQGSDGNIYYGIATPSGLKTFNYVSPEVKKDIGDPNQYRLRIIDFIHAILSLCVFAAIALYDKNVVRCFYPQPDHQTKEVLDVLPVVIGVVCSLVFTVFPTTRHGIGYPVSSHPPSPSK